jgi:hypothetical protein
VRKLGAVAVALVLPVNANAQVDPAAICGSIISDAAHNINISLNSNQFLDNVFDKYCSASGTVSASAQNAGLSAVIYSVPVGLTLGSSDSQTATSNFCRNYASTRASSSQTTNVESTVVNKALDTFVQCEQIARTGASIDHKILSRDEANVYLVAAAGDKLMIQGVSTSGPVSCTGNTGKDQVTTFTQKTTYEFEGNFLLSCARHGHSGPSNITVFDEATVTVSTKTAPYAFYWPASKELAQDDAAEIKRAIDDIQKNLTQINTSIPSVAVNGLQIKFYAGTDRQHNGTNIAGCAQSNELLIGGTCLTRGNVPRDNNQPSVGPVWIHGGDSMPGPSSPVSSGQISEVFCQGLPGFSPAAFAVCLSAK